MKYIDADKLIAEIERRQAKLLKTVSHRPIHRMDELESLLSFITSLQQEQPEVDWEKELEKWRHDHFKGKRDGDYNGEYLERESQLDLACFFWNKGYNAKEE